MMHVGDPMSVIWLNPQLDTTCHLSGPCVANVEYRNSARQKAVYTAEYTMHVLFTTTIASGEYKMKVSFRKEWL